MEIGLDVDSAFLDRIILNTAVHCMITKHSIQASSSKQNKNITHVHHIYTL